MLQIPLNEPDTNMEISLSEDSVITDGENGKIYLFICFITLRAAPFFP